MRSFLSAGLVGSMLAMSAAIPASAFPVDPSPKLAIADVIQVQFHGGGGHRIHGGGRGFHGGGFHGGGFHGRGYGGGRYYGGHGYGAGAAVGAGIAGLAAGALIGGAIANSQQPVYYGDPAPVYADPGDEGGDAEAYCVQRYRSYDPQSGTFLGNDGLRHPCP